VWTSRHCGIFTTVANTRRQTNSFSRPLSCALHRAVTRFTGEGYVRGFKPAQYFALHKYCICIIKIGRCLSSWPLNMHVRSETAGQVRDDRSKLMRHYCRLDYCNSLLCGLPDALLRKMQSAQNATARLITIARDAVIISRQSWTPLANHTIRERVKSQTCTGVHGQVQSGMSGSPVAVRAGASLLGRWSLPPVRQHSALSAVSCRSELQTCVVPRILRTFTVAGRSLDFASGTLFWFSCAIQISPRDCSDDSWMDTFFGMYEHGALWLLICGALEKHLLILTYRIGSSYLKW